MILTMLLPITTAMQIHKYTVQKNGKRRML